MFTVAADAYMTSGRLLGSVAALVALAGAISGVLAWVRSSRGNGRRGAFVALGSGSLGIATGVVVLVRATGGLGTGNGVAGGYIALALGVVAVALGWFALSRARRTV